MEDKMNIAFVGPGIMPIPPTGWGAVEMLIWDYATILGELGHTGAIINTPDREEIIKELKEDTFDIVHLHYDVFHDIIPDMLEASTGKLIVSSHYPYINESGYWHRDNYNPIVKSYSDNKQFNIFASSAKDIDTFIKHGAVSENCWLSRLGVDESSYSFDKEASYDRSICFSQICDRKRQYLIQDLDDVDFAGRVEGGFFSNGKNYKGEIPRDELNKLITKYSNFILLSSTENTTPLVVKEALICGLGVVVSEDVSVELDISEDFIDVIPESNIDDLDYIKDILVKNRDYSTKHREEIRDYGIQKFSLSKILEFEYVPKLKSLL